MRYSALPASLAWDAFRKKNGVSSFEELRERIRRYRPGSNEVDPVIGCNVLAEPFFLARDRWIPIPATFALTIVSGKSYDTESQDGAALREQVRRALTLGSTMREPEASYEADNQERFGEAFLTRGRLGQGAFRVLVTDAYQRRCAVTGERTLPVLEAAHRLEVSRRLRAEWENGREYYAYHGRELQVRPSNPQSLPGAEFLRWHNEQRFKA